MNRSLEIAAMVKAVMAVMAGARALICIIPVPSRMRSVRAAKKAKGAIASCPQASAVHTVSTPKRSASTTYVTRSSKSRSRPEFAPPTPILTLMAMFNGLPYGFQQSRSTTLACPNSSPSCRVATRCGPAGHPCVLPHTSLSRSRATWQYAAFWYGIRRPLC